MNELEKEFLNSYLDEDSLDDWRQKWLKRPEDLDKLVKSDDWQVRSHVADVRRDKDLDKLVSDPEEVVRASVAWGGRDQDLLALIGDPDPYVQEAVRDRIKEMIEELKDLQLKLDLVQKRLEER